MNRTATIYSTRDRYIHAGVTFTKAPRSYLVVDDVVGESRNAASLRHAKGHISVTELAGVENMIRRAKEYGIECALAIHNAEFEETEAERRMEEYRAELASQRRAQRDLDQQIAALRVERDAATSALEEVRLELSRTQDQVQAALAKLKEAEDGLGTIEALSKEVAKLKAAKLKDKREK